MLSQLSYGPISENKNRESQYTPSLYSLVGLGRLELPTSPLSGVRSNQLSYRPIQFKPKLCEHSRRTPLYKEVIQPQVPLRLPCYDFTPVTDPTVVGCPLKEVGAPPSGRTNSHGVTGGVYKARERIHRVMLLRDY